MAIQALITAQQVIKEAFEDQNFSPAYITPNIIIECQEANLRPALGREYYAELLAEAAAGSFSEANQFLLDTYLRPAIAFYAKAKIAPNMAARLVNAGLMQSTADPYTQPVGTALIAKGQEANASSGSFWLKAALAHMEDENNKANYPTYNNKRETGEAGSGSHSLNAWINL